jgi:hypothetical protein
MLFVMNISQHLDATKFDKMFPLNRGWTLVSFQGRLAQREASVHLTFNVKKLKG